MSYRTRRAYRDAMIIDRSIYTDYCLARYHRDAARFYQDANALEMFCKKAYKAAEKYYSKVAETPKQKELAQEVMRQAKQLSRGQTTIGRIINALENAALAVGGFFKKVFQKIANGFRILKNKIKSSFSSMKNSAKKAKEA